jgi:DNA-binding MarR family transcriptional regulator
MSAHWGRDVVEPVRLDPPTLTPVRRRLEQKKLVHRARWASTSGALVVTVTEEGRRLQQREPTYPRACGPRSGSRVNRRPS